MPDVLIVHDDPEQVRPFVEADFPDLSFHYATDEKSLGRALSELHPIAAVIKSPALPGPLHRQLLKLRFNSMDPRRRLGVRPSVYRLSAGDWLSPTAKACP